MKTLVSRWLAATLLFFVSGVQGIPQVSAQDSAEQKPANPASGEITSREITFSGSGDVSLSATLTLPKTDKGSPVPAVVMVAGSGPTDRDGNQPGLKTDLLKRIATELANNGIASIRYDKRGQYKSGKQNEGQTLKEFAQWDKYVGDAKAALDFLQGCREVDPERTALLGHSEGGLIALQLASDPADLSSQPIAMVLVSTPARRCDQILEDQISQRLKMQGATEKLTASFPEQNRKIMDQIIATGEVPEKVPPGLAPLYPSYLGPFLKSLLQFEGSEYAKKYPGPVLVVSGENDLQHQVDKETSAFQQALQDRDQGEFEVFIAPNTSHNLTQTKSKTDHGIGGETSTESMDKLTSWLGAKLANEK